MNFANLEQRMAQNYLDLLAPFVPDETAPVSAAEQRKFYDLMRNLYTLAYDEPLLFVPALHGDDAHPGRFTMSSYGKPELAKNMRKFTKTVDTMVKNMFLFGQNGEVKFNKRELAVLSRLGVDLKNLPPAWTWMATKDGADLDTLLPEWVLMSTEGGAALSRFKHCLFSADYPYTSDIYARLLGEKPFRKLESWLISRGYERYDRYDTIASDCKLCLNIANPKWDKEPPRGGYQYKIRHSGISAQMDLYHENPAILGLCIPNGLKLFLENFDKMDERLKTFVAGRTKKCNGCKYCVQTDKTGKRPFALIPVEFEGKKLNLCPYFPGYYYGWTEIDDALVEDLTRMLEFMDGFLPM